MAKTQYKYKLQLIHKHKLYIWSTAQLTALNYFLQHRPQFETITWEPASKLTTIQRSYPHIETTTAVIIQKHALNEQYFIARLLFRDQGQQIWITDQDLNPICNVTSWTQQ